MEFHSSLNPTIGVEIELQLVDDNTLDLINISPRVLADVDKNFSNRIKYELFESMIEINTNVCSTVAEVSKDIKQTLNHLEDILQNHDASINFSSLHPFAKGKDQIISTVYQTTPVWEGPSSAIKFDVSANGVAYGLSGSDPCWVVVGENSDGLSPITPVASFNF